MGKQKVELKCFLKNLSNLERENTSTWTFKVQCSHCREFAQAMFNSTETYEISGSRGTANLVQKVRRKRDNQVMIELSV
jgi:hypothetical protein